MFRQKLTVKTNQKARPCQEIPPAGKDSAFSGVATNPRSKHTKCATNTMLEVQFVAMDGEKLPSRI
jgi:hypothetical protein